MSDMILEDLVELVKQGDENAFQELYQRFYKKIYYAALKITKNQADAKDISQETFLQVHKSINSLNDNGLFIQWLNRIVASKASDLFRKNKTTTLPEDHMLFQTQQEERKSFIPEANLHFKSDHELLDYFMENIDERYRTVLVMRYFSELSIAEIAEALHIPEGTVKTRLKRGREVLRDLIHDYEIREGVELNFRSSELGAAFSAYFLYDYAQTQVTAPLFTGFSIPKPRVHSWSFSGISVCAALTATIVFCAGRILQLSGITNDATTAYETEETRNFGPVSYAGSDFTNPEDAYYELTLFAHCKKEMSEKNKDELLSIKPLYEELKRYQGVYWRMLVYREWNREFEAMIEEKY